MDATQMICDSMSESDEEEDNANARTEPLATLRVFKNKHIPETVLPLYLGENVLGRDPSTCTLPLHAQSVSKQHTAVSISVFCGRSRRDGASIEALVWDMGSMNGTRKDRLKLTPHVRYALSEGDNLMVADIPCQYTSCGDTGSLVNRDPLVARESQGTREDGEVHANGNAEELARASLGERGEMMETPARTKGLSFEQTPTQPEGSLVPESDLDSDGERGRKDRWRKTLVSESDSHVSSPTCSTFLSPTNKIIPESDTDADDEDGGDDATLAPMARNAKTTESPGEVLLAQQTDSATDVDDGDDDDDDEPGVTKAMHASPQSENTPVSSARSAQPLHFHLESDTDTEEEDDGSITKSSSAKIEAESREVEVASVAPQKFDLDSDTDEEVLPANENNAPTREAAHATPASIADISAHLEILSDSDTDMEEDSPLIPAVIAVAADVGPMSSTPPSSSGPISLSAALGPGSDADTDVDEISTNPAGTDVDPVDFRMDSDTDMEDEEEAGAEGTVGGQVSCSSGEKDFGSLQGHRASLQQCSIPVDLSGGVVAEMETQEYLSPSIDPFKCPRVPAPRPVVSSPCSDSQEEDDFVVAETQSFIVDNRDRQASPSGDYALDQTQPFILQDTSMHEDDEDGPSGDTSYQLGLSDGIHLQPQAQALATESTQAFVLSDRDVNLESTQAYPTTPSVDGSYLELDSDLEVTQSYIGSVGSSRCSAGSGIKRQVDFALEATQAYIPESHSDKDAEEEDEEQTTDIATAETQLMDFPSGNTLAMAETQPVAETQPMAMSEVEESDDEDSVPALRKRSARRLVDEEEDTQVMTRSEPPAAETQPTSSTSSDESKEEGDKPPSLKQMRSRSQRKLGGATSTRATTAGTEPVAYSDTLEQAKGRPWRGRGRKPGPRTSRGGREEEEEKEKQEPPASLRSTRSRGKTSSSTRGGTGIVRPEEERGEEEEEEGGQVRQGVRRKTRQPRENAREKKERLERERKEQGENERILKEQEEQEKMERALREQEEKQRMEREQREKEEQEREKLEMEEKERLERERKEREEKEKLERIQREKEEQERLEREKKEREERLEKEEQERIEKQRKELEEKERLEQIQKEEQERLEREKKEREERLEKEEQERVDKQRKELEEKERLEQIQKEKEEQERLEREKKEREERLEKEEQERIKQRKELQEKERLEQIQKEEKERLEREQKEREEQLEKEEQERIEKQRKELEEKERLEQIQKEEKERLEREKKEREERLEKEEQERIEKQRKELEEKERLEQIQKEEKERLEREKKEREEQLEKEEQERIEKQRKELEEKERLEQIQKEEKERLEREKKEREERLEKEEQERIEKQRKELEEKERLEQIQKEEKERLEREKKEREERLEKEEQERIEKQRKELEEKERLEQIQKEKEEQAEKERIQRERLKKEKRERERLRREKAKREQKEKLEQEERDKSRSAQEEEEDQARLETEKREREEMERQNDERERLMKEALEKQLLEQQQKEAQTQSEEQTPRITRGRRATRRTTAPCEPDLEKNDGPATRTRSRSNSSNSISSERSASGAPAQESRGGRGRGRGAKKNPPSAAGATRDIKRRRTVGGETSTDSWVANNALGCSTRSRSNSNDSLNSEVSACSSSQSRGRGTRGAGRGRGRKTLLAETDSNPSSSSQNEPCSAPKATARGRKSKRFEASAVDCSQGDSEEKPDSQQSTTTRGRRQTNATNSGPIVVEDQEDTPEDSTLVTSSTIGRGRGRKAQIKCEPVVTPVAVDDTDGVENNGSGRAKGKRDQESEHKEEKPTPVRSGRGSTVQVRRKPNEPYIQEEVVKEEAEEETIERKVRKGRQSVAKKKKKEEEVVREEVVSATNVMEQDAGTSEVTQTPTGKSSQKRGAAPMEASPVAKSPRASVPSPRSRLKAACQPYKVLFTGLVDDAGEKVVVRLGGSLALGVSDMTHLVTDKVRRTVKFLCAMARGIPVVTTQWLEKSEKAGSFLSTSAFIVKDTEPEKKFNFCLQESIRIASNQPLLQGYEIHVTKSVKPEPIHMKDIISCCGASFLAKMPSSHKEQTVVVSCEEDWPLCGLAVAASLPVVSAEFLLTGILQQKVDVEAHALPPAAPQPAGARGRGRKRT